MVVAMLESNRQSGGRNCCSKYMLILLVLYVFHGRRIEALECYSCDSNEDPECATKPGQQIAVEECATDTDECVQAVVAGTTRRGCLSRLFPNRYCPDPCKRCTKSLCNRDVFPYDRLRCFQCSGAECVKVDNKPNLLLACPFYHENDRCFMKVLHASNVQRGCEYSATDVNNCPNSCVKCDRSGCNNEPGVWERNCLQCTHNFATPNPLCWRGQDQAANKCVANPGKYCVNKNLYGQESKCFTYFNDQTNVVTRGCSSNKPFYPNGNLTECYGENCNNACIAISCNICSSKDDINCIQGNKLRSTKCVEGTQSCFSCEKKDHVRRGCADETFLSTPCDEEACYLCRDSDGCNRTSARTCYSCSSLESGDCALMSYRDTADRSNCSAHDDLCVSTVVTKLQLRYVIRGCASHVAECTAHDPLCVRCNGSLCNSVAIDLSIFDYALRNNKGLSLEFDEANYEVAYATDGGNRGMFSLSLVLIILFICLLAVILTKLVWMAYRSKKDALVKTK